MAGANCVPFSRTSFFATRITPTTATATIIQNFSPGNAIFVVFFGNLLVTPTPTINGEPVGSFTLTFNDIPRNVTLTENLPASDIVGNVTLSLNCIHGSSLICTRNGLKRIDQLNDGDEVLSGNNLDEYTKIRSICRCWIQYPGPDHDAVIFERDSLGTNEPPERLIIDPGHPMCLKHGFESLRPAGSYIDENNDKIYIRKWIDPLIQKDASIRYDLVLEKPFSHYIANGIVVQSDGEYDHRYKDLI